jgi:hypothetical protein
VLRADVPLRYALALALPSHGHRFFTAEGSACGMERATPQARIDAACETTMILFDPVVAIRALPQRTACWQLALLLEGFKGWRIRGVLLDRHDAGGSRMRGP